MCEGGRDKQQKKLVALSGREGRAEEGGEAEGKRSVLTRACLPTWDDDGDMSNSSPFPLLSLPLTLTSSFFDVSIIVTEAH